ncbi:MAG TPA: hypothetical protein VMX17_13120 [Candidatus Glassbacteria bacterium]|nr:hypothetical protein [Candidatus Glassbacteria bacterium]
MNTFGAMFLIIVAVVVWPIIGVLGGMFSGFIINLVFQDMVLNVLVGMFPGLKGLALYQIGGGLGFLGAFFKSNLVSKD